MTKICIVTATRAEYGCLRSLIDAVHHDHHFQLQLVVTGAHLLKEQGYTVERIQEDGYPIAALVDVAVDNTSELTIAHTMSRYAEGFADTFHKLMPDIVFVLGDRYELLPICSAAFMMKIPIAHLSGGDVTEGALDDAIRNAVTMLAEYHFPGTDDSAKNIIRMRGSDKNVFTVGEPTLDFYTTGTLLTRTELAETLHLDSGKRWVLMTYHPETMQGIDYNLEAVKNIIQALQSIPNVQIVITKANMDYGGKEINEYLETVAMQCPKVFCVVSSLGQLRYLSFMKQAAFVIGNSSSGIVETPFLSIPTVNVGNRQKGRHQCANIIQVSIGVNEIQAAVTTALAADKNAYNDKNYWGDGRTAEKIIEVLHSIIYKQG
ncbi:UDP-N-acetylglucosamine 2-epimerase (hydrolyzing) [Treponema sp. OMZ 305]|uniref:UDP-N-acetylglucosamine 2-epimerase n=1 Tax=Treponema sp. OMZ 305 TaxID=1659192 RepID=UPI0020A60890|nr:UDP-N-acetylglucosamine 2-epimerase [Treponema sp. OMZ 305]UTC58664.1 UDP-N-acetylglucosamine 2-epimerase (hydrolyzing) [Treponema sp. OMZ 305]